jgi:hypothetical protein
MCFIEAMARAVGLAPFRLFDAHYSHSTPMAIQFWLSAESVPLTLEKIARLTDERAMCSLQIFLWIQSLLIAEPCFWRQRMRKKRNSSERL